MTNSTLKTLLVGITIGLICGAGALYMATFNAPHKQLMGQNKQVSGNLPTENAPLYWVAPMDANFKRDKPGKSPMGMDLVPVYANENSQDSPGTVAIDPVTIQNLGVKTALVQTMSPQLTINTFGELAFAEDTIIHVHPRVAGWVETLNVRSEGDYIEQGEALYSLYAPELVNAQEEFLIALEQGNKALIRAAQSRLISLNAPQSLINSIRKSRKITRSITYYSPQSGYVSQLNIQEGFYVEPSTTMLAIASVEQLWVMADVFASDANKIKIGQTAKIQNEYTPRQTMSATLDYIYPTVDTNTRTVKARFLLQNPHLTLKPGMYLKVSIEAFSKGNHHVNKILAVPKQAVIRTGAADRIVLSLGDGKYKSVKVTLGRVFDNVFEVLNGLEDGDEVVISAQFLLDSESSIRSDLMRMEAPKNAHEAQHNSASNTSSWTQATVNELILNEGMVSLSHGPLEAFNMMGMTMNFMLSDTIDIADFSPGQKVHVEIIKSASGMFEVKTVHFMANTNDTNGMENTREKDNAL